MNFTIEKSIEILTRTPSVLEDLLQGISDDWSNANEGENTFSPYVVIGHLIHGEKTDWIPRMEIILSDDAVKTFEPYDRFAQLEESKGKCLAALLQEFRSLREKNLALLKAKKISEAALKKTATHPALGTVTLQQLLATWTVHDLSHIGQIVRVMCKHYKEEVGPWQNYLPILTR